MILRFGMTLLLALLTGSLMGLMFFRKDSDARIEAIAARANAPLVVVASERFDAETARLTTERGTALVAVNAADSDSSALRQSVLRETEADPERGFLVERVRLLTREREAAERRVAQAQRQAVGPDASGSAMARLASARRQLEAVTRDLGAAQARLREMQARRDSREVRFTGTVEGRLKEVGDARQAAATRLAELDAAIAARASIREATIREAVLRDPAYTPKDDGLLARLKALADLTRDPYIFWAVIILDAFFVALELAAVLSKVTTFVPATYALLMVRGIAIAGQEVKEELIARLKLEDGGTSDGHGATVPIMPEVEPVRLDPASPDPAAEAVAGAPALDDRLLEGARAAQKRQDILNAGHNKRPGNGSYVSGGANPPPGSDDPVRRGPGRPPGAKNKPKPEQVGGRPNGRDVPDDYP